MRRRLLASVGGKALPYDAEVEYLESTGIQWIDTEIMPSPFHAYFTGAKGVRDNGAIFGVRRDNNSATDGFQLFADVGEYSVRFDGTLKYTGVNINTYVDAELCYGDRRIILNGKRFDISYSGQIATDLPIWVFNRCNKVSPFNRYAFRGRIYYFAIIDDLAVEIMGLKPVRFTNENGVSEGAMFDRVSGQLFRNAGTGAFIIGPDK